MKWKLNSSYKDTEDTHTHTQTNIEKGNIQKKKLSKFFVLQSWHSKDVGGMGRYISFGIFISNFQSRFSCAKKWKAYQKKYIENLLWRIWSVFQFCSPKQKPNSVFVWRVNSLRALQLSPINQARFWFTKFNTLARTCASIYPAPSFQI